MEIMLLHVEDCPSLPVARRRLDEALGRLGRTATVTEQVVTSASEGDALGFHGSPTILIDGADPFADCAVSSELACRLYRTAGGVEGAPSVDALSGALGALGA